MNRFQHAAALAAVIALAAPAALGQTICPINNGTCGFSVSAGSVAQVALNYNQTQGRRYQRITDGTATDLWCTRVPGATPAVNGIGSFRIVAGGIEEFPLAGLPYVPQAATYCTAASGTATGSVETN